MEQKALAYLPARLADAAARGAKNCGGTVAEIRLRRGCELALTVEGREVRCGAVCTPEEIAETVNLLCGGSLYAHAESLREGVIVTAGGIRAGIAGQAVVENGRVSAVRDISSVNLRLPHRIPGAADELADAVRSYGSTLLFAPPGLGKTTMLRELIPLLSTGEDAHRLSVIDTRYELGAGLGNCGSADFFSGWPRGEGITAAVRTMSPEYVVCDELAGKDDVQAVHFAASAGVMTVASVHALDYAGLCRNPLFGELIGEGLFGCVCGICMTDGKRRLEVYR